MCSYLYVCSSFLVYMNFRFTGIRCWNMWSNLTLALYNCVKRYTYHRIHPINDGESRSEGNIRVIYLRRTFPSYLYMKNSELLHCKPVSVVSVRQTYKRAQTCESFRIVPSYKRNTLIRFCQGRISSRQTKHGAPIRNWLSENIEL